MGLGKKADAAVDAAWGASVYQVCTCCCCCCMFLLLFGVACCYCMIFLTSIICPLNPPSQPGRSEQACPVSSDLFHTPPALAVARFISFSYHSCMTVVRIACTWLARGLVLRGLHCRCNNSPEPLHVAQSCLNWPIMSIAMELYCFTEIHEQLCSFKLAGCVTTNVSLGAVLSTYCNVWPEIERS